MLRTMSEKHAWREVANAVLSGMAELGLTQKELAERSGVSTATLRKLTSGAPNRYRPQTLSRVSIALGWSSGRLKAISEGHPHRPERLVKPDPAELTAKIDALPLRWRRAIAQLIDDLLAD